MEWKRYATVRQAIVAAAALGLVFAAAQPRASAQTNQETVKPAQPAPETVKTFFLANISESNDLSDIQTDLRNSFPNARMYGVYSQNAITVRGSADDVAAAGRMIAELDRPRPLYRLTFTIADVDAGKRTNAREFVLLAVPGKKSNFKQGSRMPILTGTSDDKTPGAQVQYVDLGLSIEAMVSGSPEGIALHAKVEQSNLSEEKPAATPDPVIRQIVLDESALLAPGKPLVLGLLDIPGSSRRQEIAVTAELVR